MARKPKRDLTVEEQLARGPLDLPFLMLVLLLLGIGLIMMFSASYATAYYTEGDPLTYISRQALFGAVGVVGMFVVSKINYQTFRWMSVPALIGSIILLVLVFTPLGVTHNQARRWLKLGIEFQPSEFAKIAVILFFAARLCKRDTEKHKRYTNRTFTGRMLNRLERVGFLELVPYGAILLLVAALMLKQPHMSGTILVLAGGEQRALELQTLLREQKVKSAVEFQLKDLPKSGEIVVTLGGLSAGMEYPQILLAVVTEGGGTAVRRPKRQKDTTNRQKLKSYADLAPGDLVVHEHHGVGRYVGMVKMPVDGVERDYVKIAYAGTDVLYVPATQLDLVSKYIGGGEDANETKKLSRLGGGDWEKAKSKARKAVKDLAKGLIALYAQRQRQPGAYPARR